MTRARTIIFLCIAFCAIGAFAAQSQQTPSNPSAQTPSSPATQPPSAQSTEPATGQAEQGQHPQMPSIDEQVKRLSARLTLTDDQQIKAKTILEDQHTQAQILMKDDSLSQDDKRQKFMGVRQATISKIRDILNEDQKKKFDAMLQEMQGAPKGKQGDASSPKK